MNEFNFIMPKNEKLNLDEIKKLDYAKLYFRNDFSQLAPVLNNLILSNFSSTSLPYEDTAFYKEYVKLIDIFQFSLKHLHTLQNKTNNEVIDQYKKFNKKREELNKLKKQKDELSNKTNILKEKMDHVSVGTQNVKEQAKDLNYKYICPDCLQVTKTTSLQKNKINQVYESKRELFVHIKASHDQKFQIEATKTEEFQFEEKEVQTKPPEKTETLPNLKETYDQIENAIDQKLNENIRKLRIDLESQFQLSDKKNEQLRTSLKEIENIQIQTLNKKEEDQIASQEKTEQALKSLENNFKQTNEIFNSFQNLVLSFHQSEVKKLEDISSTIVNLKLQENKEPIKLIQEGRVDRELQDKMIDHLELIEDKLKESSPKKVKKPQQVSPLKMLFPSKDWAVGELESDKDSDEFMILPEELLSNTLRFPQILMTF